MYKLVAALITTMTAASAAIVIGVVVYSIVLAVNESSAPRGSVYVTEIATPQDEVRVLADTKDEISARSPLPL